MAVPYTFGTATASIPLSQLDSNFATAITLGNTSIQLGNTVSTLNNMTLANVTISSGNITLTNVSATTANVTTANVVTMIVTGNETVQGNTTVTGTITGAKLIPTGTSVTGNGMYLPATNAVGISTNGTNAVYIDSSQNVGIGVTSTGGYKVAVGGSGLKNQFIATDANNAYLYTDGNAYFGSTAAFNTAFITNNTERARIDSSGNVGIGTSSPSTGTLNKQLTINSGASALAGVVLQNNTTGAGSTDGTALYINSDDANLINYETGNLVFGTSATERARFDSSGNFLVGTTSLTGKLCVSGSPATLSVGTLSGDADGTYLTIIRPGVTGVYHRFASTTTYQITNNSAGVSLANGGTSWGAVSDERRKDIIEPIENALVKVATLRAVIGKYKTDDDGKRRPFLIAQDVLKVFPEAVDSTDPDNLSLLYTEVTPLLIAAIKEQQALITQLTDRIAALEAK